MMDGGDDGDGGEGDDGDGGGGGLAHRAEFWVSLYAGSVSHF